MEILLSIMALLGLIYTMKKFKSLRQKQLTLRSGETMNEDITPDTLLFALSVLVIIHLIFSNI